MLCMKLVRIVICAMLLSLLFYGAMYVSYGLGVAFAVAAFIISYVFIGSTLRTAFIAIIATLIVFMPVMMRLSRNIWINMFVSFDKN